jgi:hypothetical protein
VKVPTGGDGGGRKANAQARGRLGFVKKPGDEQIRCDSGADG